MVGRSRPQKTRPSLIVMSDHGFAAFNRGVNLNTGCSREGFLDSVERPEIRRSQSMDWKKNEGLRDGA